MQEKSNGERQQGQGSRGHVAIGNRRARHMQLRGGWMVGWISGTRPCRPCYPRFPAASGRDDLVSRACPFWGGDASPMDPRSSQPPTTTRRRGVVQAAAVASRDRAMHRARAGTVFSFLCLSPWMQRTSPIMEAGVLHHSTVAACWWSHAEVTWPLSRNAPRP